MVHWYIDSANKEVFMPKKQSEQSENKVIERIQTGVRMKKNWSKH